MLPSGADEFVPETIDQSASLARWKLFCPSMSHLSALIPEASHAVEEIAAQKWLAQRVAQFLIEVETPPAPPKEEKGDAPKDAGRGGIIVPVWES